MNNKYTKRDYVENILKNQTVAERGLTTKEVGAVVDTFLDLLKESIIKIQPDERIELRGFGTFGVKTRKARTARNPKTGDKVIVPTRKGAYWKPGSEIKGSLN